MVICKFFLQGNCRFGDYCKFEHHFGDSFTNIQQKNSTSILRQPHFGGSQPVKPPNPVNSNAVDPNTLVKSVVNDMTVAEKGGQWLLSCYGPCKEQPSFPGFEDQSAEEIRLGYYEARKNGTVEQYKQQIQIMLQQAMLKLKSLQSPSPDIINMLKTLYATPQQAQPGIFGGNTFTANSTFNNITNPQQQTFNQQPSSSIFAQANQSLFQNKPPEPNIFGATQNTSIFGGQANTSPFGGQANNSPFGGQVSSPPFGAQTNNPPFGGQVNSPPFGSTNPQMQTPNKNLFAGGGANPASGASIFGAAAVGNPIAGSNIFSNAQPSNTIFNAQQTTSPFGNTPLQVTSPVTQPQASSNVFVKQPANIFAAQNTAIPFNQPAAGNVLGATPIQNVPQTFAEPAKPPMFPQQSVFAQQTQQPASNSPFGPQTKTNLEAQQSNIFGGGQPPAMSIFGGQQQQPIDETIYSKPEDLTDEEIKWFESDDLDIMNIPEKPPTFQMCFKT